MASLVGGHGEINGSLWFTHDQDTKENGDPINNVWSKSRFIWHKQLFFTASTDDIILFSPEWNLMMLKRSLTNFISSPIQADDKCLSKVRNRHGKDYSVLLTWEWKINIDLVGKKPAETYIICEGVSSRKKCRCFVGVEPHMIVWERMLVDRGLLQGAMSNQYSVITWEE